MHFSTSWRGLKNHVQIISTVASAIVSIFLSQPIANLVTNALYFVQILGLSRISVTVLFM